MLLEIRPDETAVVRPLVQRIRRAVNAHEAVAARHEVDERVLLRRGERQLAAGEGEHDDIVATQRVGGNEGEIFGRGDCELAGGDRESRHHLARRRNRVVAERGGRGCLLYTSPEPTRLLS